MVLKTNSPEDAYLYPVGKMPTKVLSPFFTDSTSSGLIKNKDESQISWDVTDEDWGWGQPKENENEVSNNSASPQFSKLIKSDTLISSSFDASMIVIGTDKKLGVYGLDSEKCYNLLFTVEAPESDIITAVTILPLYTSVQNSRLLLAVGFISGCLKIFSNGVVIFSQTFASVKVAHIKLRTNPYRMNLMGDHHQESGCEDELLVVFENGLLVCIDGLSLWTALKLVSENDQFEGKEDTPLMYKKWFIQSEGMQDVVSLGPHSGSTPFLKLIQPPLSSSPFLTSSSTTARFLASSSHPMLHYFATTDSTRSSSMVGMVASTVTSAVVSFAKSFWGGSSGISQTSSIQTPGHESSTKTLPLVMTLADPYRKIIGISLSPPSPSTGRPPLAALSDSLGRVLLMDVDEGYIVRMWKGMRLAQCGWIEVVENHKDSSISAKRILLLAIYSPKRGIVEVFKMWNGGRVCTLNVGCGCRLLSPNCHAMGEGNAVTVKSESISQCFIMQPSGDIKLISIPFEVALGSLRYKEIHYLRSYSNIILSLSNNNWSNDGRILTCVQDFTTWTFKLKALLLLEELNPPYQLYLDVIRNLLIDTFQLDESELQSLKKNDEEVKAKLKIASRKYLAEVYATIMNKESQYEKSDEDKDLYSWTMSRISSFYEGLNDEVCKGDGGTSMGIITFIRSFSLIEPTSTRFSYKVDNEMECRSGIRELSKFLLTPYLSGELSLSQWSEKIYQAIGISTNCWMQLLINWINYSKSLPVPEEYVKILSVFRLIFSQGVLNMKEGKDLLVFLKQTHNLHYAVTIYTYFTEVHEPSLQNEEEWRELKEKVTDMILLIKGVEPKKISELGISLFSFLENEANSPIFFRSNVLLWRNPDSINGLDMEIIITQIFILCNCWKKDPSSDRFRRIFDRVDTLRPVSLKVAIILNIWEKFFMSTFGETVLLVEKSRKAPKDKMSIKFLEISSDSCVKFLKFLINLLSPLLDEEVFVEEMQSSFLPFVHMKNSEYYNGSFGQIQQYLGSLKVNCSVNRSVVNDHIVMSQVLLCVFEYDLKMIRPMKMFDVATFGISLVLMPEDPDPSLMTPSDSRKLMTERQNLLSKVMENNVDAAVELAQKIKCDLQLFQLQLVYFIFEKGEISKAKQLQCQLDSKHQMALAQQLGKLVQRQVLCLENVKIHLSEDILSWANEAKNPLKSTSQMLLNEGVVESLINCWDEMLPDSHEMKEIAKQLLDAMGKLRK